MATKRKKKRKFKYFNAVILLLACLSVFYPVLQKYRGVFFVFHRPNTVKWSNGGIINSSMPAPR